MRYANLMKMNKKPITLNDEKMITKKLILNIVIIKPSFQK